MRAFARALLGRHTHSVCIWYDAIVDQLVEVVELTVVVEPFKYFLEVATNQSFKVPVSIIHCDSESFQRSNSRYPSH